MQIQLLKTLLSFLVIFVLFAAPSSASKLISCPGVPEGSVCSVSLVSLSGSTPTTLLTAQGTTEIADPSLNGKSDYVYNYAGTLHPVLEYRVWCYCTKASDAYYWIYAWEPFENSINVALDTRASSSEVAKETTLQRGLGLMMENHIEDDITRDNLGYQTSSKFYLYDSKANAQLHDKATGLLATYTTSTSYNSKRQITLFSVVKD